MTGNESFLPAVVPSIDSQSPLLTGFETNTQLGIRDQSPLGVSVENGAPVLPNVAAILDELKGSVDRSEERRDGKDS